jgi:hypothetical protein
VGESEAALGYVLRGTGPPAKASGTLDRAGWGCRQARWAVLGGRGRGQSHLGPQLPTGSWQASSSRCTLGKRNKGNLDTTPPSPSQMGKTPTFKPGSQLGASAELAASASSAHWDCPGQGLTFVPSGPLSPGGPMSPGNP